MTNELLPLTLAVLLPVAAGYFIVLFLFRREPLDVWTSLAAGFGIGTGTVSFGMLLLAFLNLPFTAASAAAVPAITLLAGIVLCVKYNVPLIPQPARNGPSEKNTVIDTFFASLILFFLFYVAWTSLNMPVSVWDELERIALKAKILVHERSLVSLPYTPHAAYPLHIEFCTAWIALALGSWNDQLIKIFCPLFFAAFLRIVYYFLRQFAGKTFALGGVCLMFLSPLFLHQATVLYVDFPLMFYNCGAVLFLILWRKRNDDSFLAAAGLFAGIAAFTKLEATFYIALQAAVLLFIVRQTPAAVKKKGPALLRFILPAAALCAVYHIYKLSAGIPLLERVGFDFTFDKMSRLPVVIEGFTRNLILSGNWGIIWILVVLSLVRIIGRLRNTEVNALTLALLLFLGLQFAQLLLTPNFMWISGDKAYTVFARLVLHFFPLAPILLTLVYRENGGN